MVSRLADHLRAARRRHFVGRDQAKTLFQAALEAGTLEYFVLFVHGPGGLGKTSLLREFEHAAQLANCLTAYIDARNVDPLPDVFLSVLKTGLTLNGAQPFADELAAVAAQRRTVVLLDTYEHLNALDHWLRDTFMPQLPENVFFVIASRDEPSRGWRSDPGWQMLLHSLALRNLDAAESADYLLRRNVPAAQHDAIIQFTHGYPLALSLIADVIDQQPDYRFQPERAPDIVSMLVAQFLDEVPSPAHRATLDVCCLVRGTTESLLADVLRIPDTHELFRWLRGLSFIDSGPRGLFPHDMARDILHADLRWRNPDWYAELHRRARHYYTNRFQQLQGQEQQRALFDLIYLHRDNPVVQSMFAWHAAAASVPDRLQPRDVPLLIEMVRRHEGDASAAIAAHWIARQPQGVLVLRDPSQRPTGFVHMLALDAVNPADHAIDPAVRATRTYLDHHATLRSGETATLFRFWMVEDTYQDVSPGQSILFTNMVRHYLITPRLAYTFLPCADPDFWRMGFEYGDLARIPAADYTIGDRTHGVYGHDWRITPPLAWLTLMGDRELGAAVSAPEPSHTPALIVLSESEFAAAARQALQHVTQPDRLRTSPLIWSKLVADQVQAEDDAAVRAAALQRELRAAVDVLAASPKDIKLHRAVYHTYVQPAATQEAAAELLDLPFSTYRRHLKDGVDRVIRQLWGRETGEF